VLFAIIAEYDAEVRWRRDAATLRDALARAALNCKTPDDQTFAEAQDRAGDVEDVVRGGRLARNPARPLTADKWNTIAERPQLMKRIETAFQVRIRPQLADARQFSKAAVEVRHEAEMMAALAEVIRRPQYEYWDDDTFVDYARQLQAAATDLSRAAASQDYDAARAAASRAGQACADCHDGYRL
jgi:cytochrome c556